VTADTVTATKRIISVLTLSAAAGGLVIAVAPAQAATRSHLEPSVNLPALSCTYHLQGIRPSSFLYVREGPGLRYRSVGRLRVTDGRFAGACSPSQNWVAVKSSNGTPGWAAARYLRKLSLTQPSSIDRPSLSCQFRVSGVRRGSFLNVRRGPGLRYHPIGALRTSDGQFAGGCASRNGWVAVNTPSGRPGWASGHYLHKLY
jgi:uncharacterized protein YraI